MTVTTKGAVKLRALAPSQNPQTPAEWTWKFKSLDYSQIRAEYNAIREKATKNPSTFFAIRAAHSEFADKFPQLFFIAASPHICDSKVHLMLDMSERAQQTGQDGMDEEAALLSERSWKEHTRPSRV